MKIAVLLPALLLSTPALASSTLVCSVEKVGLTDSRQSTDCGKFSFTLPMDFETKKGTGACAGLELDSRLFRKGDHESVQFVLQPSKEELGPNGNSGYAWVGFRDRYPEEFSLQAIGATSNYVVRCAVTD